MKLQAPKGTRDFYPREMARRNFILDAWRRVSIRNGFEQVDGPIFESLDLYKIKSGDGIVSELFHFEDRGQRQLALRPEFTPTLARMVAAQANALAKPIKWFSTPNLCRAERPQRGRLREFFQWNVDILGTDAALADAECIFTAVDLMMELGLDPLDVKVKISHRQTVGHILAKYGVPEDKMAIAFDLLDRRGKIDQKTFEQETSKHGLDAQQLNLFFDDVVKFSFSAGPGKIDELASVFKLTESERADLETLNRHLTAFGIFGWCEFDFRIVRGLAYYTGTVFEVHEANGAERAMAGGGRYDGLIELFGGPKMPAVGLGMGDVVLMNVLADKGLFPDDVSPHPDAFVLAVTDLGDSRLAGVVADLRQQGLHTRFSYKTTRNLGKLLKDVSAASARYAVILDDQAADNATVVVKDMANGQQEDVPLDGLAQRIAKQDI